MKLINGTISLAELRDMSNKMFGGIVKGVVDVNREIMVVDAPMHADEEAMLLESGSTQTDLWGINIYPLENSFDLEFDSMINVRPNQNNFSRSVEDTKLQKEIKEIVDRLIKI